MTGAQVVFLGGLSIVLLLILGFAGLVVGSALSSGGGARVGLVLLRRMVGSPLQRAELNRWASYLHRISGFAISAFLALHIGDVALYSFSRRLYDNVHTLYGTSAMRIFECGLVFAVLFHAVNGLRLLAIDLADLGMVKATRALASVIIVTVGSGAVACWYVLRPVFG